MPCPAVEIDALPRNCLKSERFARFSAIVGGHDDQKRIVAHRDKRLTSVRVSLDHVEAEWQPARLRLEQADARAAIRKVQQCTIMKPPAKALIYDLVGLARRVENIAKGRERLGGQRRNTNDLRHAPSFSIRRNSAIRST